MKMNEQSSKNVSDKLSDALAALHGSVYIIYIYIWGVNKKYTKLNI